MNITEYAFHTGKLSRPVRMAVISDLHNTRIPGLLDMTRGADCLLVPGDVVNRYHQTFENGIEFLSLAAKRLPTFFSPGNHEARLRDKDAFMRAALSTGAVMLINDYAIFGEIAIGGWYLPDKDSGMMQGFERLPKCRVLMCHKPDHYMKYLRNADIDLAIAGHAHGGQICVRGRGLYAPGQGFFPKYTRGLTDGRLIISAGVSNPVPVPRWGNPLETLMITLD